MQLSPPSPASRDRAPIRALSSLPGAIRFSAVSLALLTVALFGLSAPAVSAGQEVAAVVRGMQDRYASVRSISADFTQTYRAPGIEQVESGTLYMKKPGLMRWEYRDPEVKLFVADGSESYLYTPDDRQVLVQKLSAQDLHSTPLQFLLGEGDITKSFSVSPEEQSRPKVEGTVLLRLIPNASEPDYAYLIIECDEKTFDIRRIIIHERLGNTSEFLLSNLATNVKIDDKEFRFKIPKGVEVIRLDEK